MSDTENIDLLVIGGGINGAGIARDASGRGLSVMLCEMNDFGSATSSASSKLIHGGLRYLEHYEFSLVRKSLIERERLLASAPHIIWPLRFVLPHHSKLRPAWLIRLGLFLYDHMGGRKLLPPTSKVRLQSDPRGTPLKDHFKLGFEYSDCWVDDARMVILLVMDAVSKGAKALKGWKCVSASRASGLWTAELEDHEGLRRTVKAKAIVNASGSWAADIANQLAGNETKHKKTHKLRLVKGSHIVLPKLYDGDHAYTFQEADGRIIFAIPYENDFTLVGTTDVAFKGDPASPSTSDDEKAYLCKAISGYLKQNVSPDQVIWHYSGIRPLVDDGEEDASQVTRDYILAVDSDHREAPLLSVFGGKITTFRKLAEQAMADLSPWFPDLPDAWTEHALLPGGDMKGLDHMHYQDLLANDFPWVDASQLARYIRQFGSRTYDLLAGCKSADDLGKHLGADLYELELKYLQDNEWATSAEDVIWRRTKLGLRLSETEQQTISDWFQRQP